MKKQYAVMTIGWLKGTFAKGLCLVLLLLPGMSPDAGGADVSHQAKNPLMEKARQISLAREYQKRIEETVQEIREFRESRTWLRQQIRHLEAFGRRVPESMTLSLEQKEARIRSLETLTSLLEERLGEFMKEMPMPEKTLEDTGPSADPPVSQSAGTGCGSKAFADEIRQKLSAGGLEAWVALVEEKGCCRLESRLPILFPTASAAVAEEYHTFLKSLANLIRDYDVRVHVNGYADEESISTKEFPSNFELGAMRAANVIHILMKEGIKPSVFSIATSGRYRFEAKGMSPKKAFERRVNLEILFAK